MFTFFAQQWYPYLVGLGVGFMISVRSMAISIVLGTLGALGRRSGSGVVRAIAGAYVAVFRGIPPLLSLYIVYFGLPTWAADADFPIISAFFEPLGNRIFAAVVAFTLASGAYSTEIIRAGIESVHEEQFEAARSIGMSHALAFRRIIAPQAFRIAFPPLSNEYLAVLKATSLASVIGVVELMRTAQIAASLSFEYLVAYSMAGIYYIVFVITLQTVLDHLERRFPGASSPTRH